MIKRTPVDLTPRTHIPWVRSDYHDCPDKRSSNKSMRIRADGYAKCFRCGWKGWLDGRRSTEQEIERANKRQARHGRFIDQIVAECREISNDDPVSRYLGKRHLTQPWPKDLRYHAALHHGPSKQKLPAMVALLRDAAGSFKAIHRTYLTHAGDKADVDPVRMVMGKTRNAAFHAEMLPARTPDGTLVYKANHSQPRTTVCVCEGVEDALALRLMYPGYAAWATISAENMAENEPPAEYSGILLVPDRDNVGMQAVKQLYHWLRTDLDQARIDRVTALRDDLYARRAEGEDVSVFMEDHMPLSELRRRNRGARSVRFVWLKHAKDPAAEWARQQEVADAG